MKCPLLVRSTYSTFEHIESGVSDCLKEECAWWYAENNVCAVLTLAQGSVYVHKVLLSLASKTPLGGAK